MHYFALIVLEQVGHSLISKALMVLKDRLAIKGHKVSLELLVRKDQSERLDHKVSLVWTVKQQMRQ